MEIVYMYCVTHSDRARIGLISNCSEQKGHRHNHLNKASVFLKKGNTKLRCQFIKKTAMTQLENETNLKLQFEQSAKKE